MEKSLKQHKNGSIKKIRTVNFHAGNADFQNFRQKKRKLINQNLVNIIVKSFEREDVKQLLKNDFLGDYWYIINKSSNNHSVGFCYLASELYYFLDGKSKKWWFKEITSTEYLPYNGKHFYLENKQTGEILDITKMQYNDIKIPYHLAKNKGIRYMSKNCNKLKKILQL